MVGSWLRVIDPVTGMLIPTPEEERQARLAAEEARLMAEEARLAAEEARMTAESAREAAEEARQAAEERAARLEADLRAALARLARGSVLPEEAAGP